MSNELTGDLVEWARTMGFPGADSPEFKNNAGRLVTPQLATMWRHLMKHVRPANEVAQIRKQLLAYKLGIDNNPSVNSSKKFETVAAYEAFLKKSGLEAKMMHCNMHVEKKQEHIKKLLTKLEEKGGQHQLQKQEEKEKMEKLRQLRAKREELEKQVVFFKQMVPELESIMQPKYQNRHNPLDSWELEVQKYCASLERGQEISVMCEHLREAFKPNNDEQPTAKEILTGNEDLMFLKVIEDYHAKLGFELIDLTQKYKAKSEELEVKKQNLMSTMPSGDVAPIARARVLERVIESGHLEKIGKAAERAFLLKWIRDNRTGFDNLLSTSYVEENEKVAELDRMIAQVLDEISFFAGFPAAKLRSSLDAITSKMKAEAAAACYKEKTPSTIIDKILSDLPQLIESFKKMSMFTKEVDPGTQSIQAFNELKNKFSKTATAKAFDTLNVSIKEKITDSSSLVEQVQEKMAREESRMGVMVNDLNETLHEIECNLQHIKGHLNCWEKSSATEVQELLARLKNAPLERPASPQE